MAPAGSREEARRKLDALRAAMDRAGMFRNPESWDALWLEPGDEEGCWTIFGWEADLALAAWVEKLMEVARDRARGAERLALPRSPTVVDSETPCRATGQCGRQVPRLPFRAAGKRAVAPVAGDVLSNARLTLQESSATTPKVVRLSPGPHDDRRATEWVPELRWRVAKRFIYLLPFTRPDGGLHQQDERRHPWVLKEHLPIEKNPRAASDERSPRVLVDGTGLPPHRI